MITGPAVKKLKPIAKPEVVEHRKVYVDTDILSPLYSHLSDSVNYGVFKDDGGPAILLKDMNKAFNIILKDSDVCFSGLLNQIATCKANRMYYELHTVSSNRADYPPLLVSEERSQWLSLAKEYKLLPPYINEDAIRDKKAPSKLAGGTFIINLEEITQSLLYIYLSTMRNIREDPGLPRSVLYLVNDLGMNFYLAYMLASKIVMNDSGHHIVGLDRGYGTFKQEYKNGVYTYTPLTSDQLNEKIAVPISMAIGLQRIVNDPGKYDKKSAMTCGGRFMCGPIIESVSKVKYEAMIQELFDENIIATAMSKTDKEANDYINKVTSSKTIPMHKEVGK